jgi:pilus assembly protein Flp/PilA
VLWPQAARIAQVIRESVVVDHPGLLRASVVSGVFWSFLEKGASMRKLWNLVVGMGRKEEGASMVEYGLLVALIAVVVAAALGPLGTAVAAMFNGITGQI